LREQHLRNLPESAVRATVGSAFRIELDKVGGGQGFRIARQELTSLSSSLAALFSGPTMITASTDWRALSLYSVRWWDQLLPRIWRLPKENLQARRFMSLFLGYAQLIDDEEDFHLSESTSSYADLNNVGVIFAFSEDYAEIWSESQLDAVSLGIKLESI
tara:strand:+ start:147 stop:626 length:480 start_codon:yes stop_codon:yes gene_type:complete